MTQPHAECPEPIGRWFNDAVNRGRTPAAQYVAVNAQGQLASCAVGLADLASARSMTPNTTLMAYSMSKTITAIAVLQLVECDLIELDAPVEHYLPDSPYGPAITIRDLLAHLGGLPNPIPLRWVHAAREHATFDERAAINAILRANPKLAHPPGTRYRYSNIGYWMLGMVVERVTGGRFADYVRQHVFDAVGLTAEDLGCSVADPTQHASGYLERWSPIGLFAPFLIDRTLLGDTHGRWRQVRDHYPNGPAFGGLVGTAAAFGRILQDLLQPRSVLLGNRGRTLLETQQKTRAGTDVPMTLGWHLGERHGTRVLFKEGGGGGFHCLMRIYPSRGLGSVVMTNATRFDVHECLNTVDPMLPAWTACGRTQG